MLVVFARDFPSLFHSKIYTQSVCWLIIARHLIGIAVLFHTHICRFIYRIDTELLYDDTLFQHYTAFHPQIQTHQIRCISLTFNILISFIDRSYILVRRVV